MVFIETPQGQLSWHVSPDDVDLFSHVPIGTGGSIWDGHSTEEKYARLDAHTRALAQREG